MQLCNEEKVGNVDVWDFFVSEQDVYRWSAISGKVAAVVLLMDWTGQWHGQRTVFKLDGQRGLTKKSESGQEKSSSKRIQGNIFKVGRKCVCLNARSIRNMKN